MTHTITAETIQNYVTTRGAEEAWKARRDGLLAISKFPAYLAVSWDELSEDEQRIAAYEALMVIQDFLGYMTAYDSQGVYNLTDVLIIESIL